MPDLQTCLQFPISTNHFYPDSFPVTRNFEIDRWNSELAYMAQVEDEIDRLSGHSIVSLNKALHEHLDEGGFRDRGAR